MLDAPVAAVFVLFGLARIYLGCRGWQARGIVIWHRTGEISRIVGWAGRVVATVLIVADGMSLWAGLAAAHLPGISRP
ncbi:MAG TPA: hypothetical protein VIP11_18330 [Gemmatimonadaceae bacterium]